MRLFLALATLALGASTALAQGLPGSARLAIRAGGQDPGATDAVWAAEVEAALVGALAEADGWQTEADGSLMLTSAGAERIRARPR